MINISNPLILFALILVVLSAAGCAGQSDEFDTQPAPVTDDELRNQLDEVLDMTFERRLNTEINGAWQILHGVLAYGKQFRIEHDGKFLPAVDWLIQGGEMKGWDFQSGDKGPKALLQKGSATGQGHDDQWLAVLSQCGLTKDQQFTWGSKTFTIDQWVEQVKWDLPDKEELSWTLIPLSRYVPLRATWKAKNSQEWSLERMMAFEAEQEPHAGACGDTHRLIGMTMALKRYRKQFGDVEKTGHKKCPECGGSGKHSEAGHNGGEVHSCHRCQGSGKVENGWLKAHHRIEQAVEDAKQFQKKSDGSFSANYFREPASSTIDVEKRLGTSGHTLEFLVLTLNDEQLKEPWVTKAVLDLCKYLRKTREQSLECGRLYHAVHSLTLYRERRFGPRTYGKQPSEQE